MRQAKIYNHELFARVLTENENGYTFQYNADYLKSHEAEAISLTMPLTEKPYNEKILFPFFDGLIPEGWLLWVYGDVIFLNHKLNYSTTCRRSRI